MRQLDTPKIRSPFERARAAFVPWADYYLLRRRYSVEVWAIHGRSPDLTEHVGTLHRLTRTRARALSRAMYREGEDLLGVTVFNTY